jgi:hypothetical protein
MLRVFYYTYLECSLQVDPFRRAINRSYSALNLATTFVPLRVGSVSIALEACVIRSLIESFLGGILVVDLRDSRVVRKNLRIGGFYVLPSLT